MHIETLLDSVNWLSFLMLYGAIVTVACLGFRRACYGVFDPAWLAPLTLSVSVSLMAYLNMTQQMGSTSELVYLLAALGAFIFGARISAHVPRRPLRRPASTDALDRTGKDLMRVLVFLEVALVVLVLVRATTQGLPILSADPELAKVEVNAGGFGLITRFQGPLTMVALAVVFFLRGRGIFTLRQASFAMLIPLAALLSSGSKGSLFGLIIAYAAARVYLRSRDKAYQPGGSVWFLIASIAGIIGYAFIVLVLRAVGDGLDSPLEFAAGTFALRLVAFADAVFYYFGNELQNQIVSSPADYMWDYIAGPLLGFLRLADYPISLGLRISGEMFGQDKLGPNPTMFVEGRVYFGQVFGVVYTFCIGLLFSWLRSLAASRPRQTSALRFCAVTLVFSMAQLVFSDMLLFVGELINTALTLALLAMVVGTGMRRQPQQMRLAASC